MLAATGNNATFQVDVKYKYYDKYKYKYKIQVHCLPKHAVEVPQHSAGQAGQRQQDRNVSKNKNIHLVVVVNKIKCLIREALL